jgi:RNA polymerase sigma-70 factor, ECF subfamily
VGVKGSSLDTRSEIERIYRSDGSRLWWSLVAFSGDREIASDALAEAFSQALGRGDELTDPLAWVWHVAYRIAAGELKRRATQVANVPDAADPNGQAAMELIGLLRRLPQNQRAAVILHYYADFPVSQIASLMDVSAATVKVHLHRGRMKLMKLLEDEHE